MLFKEKSRELQVELDDLRNYRSDTEYEVKDITATLEYMKLMIIEPRAMWVKASRDLKLVLQRLWFPDGITFLRAREARTTLNAKESTLSKKILTLVQSGYPIRT